MLAQSTTPNSSDVIHHLPAAAAHDDDRDVAVATDDDDGFGSYGDAGGGGGGDVDTIHMSAKSTRKPRHPSGLTTRTGRRVRTRQGFVSSTSGGDVTGDEDSSDTNDEIQVS